MKKNRSHYGLGIVLKYFIIALTLLFFFAIISDVAEKSLDKSIRFDCWKFEQYATDYEGFWITAEEDIACRAVGIIVNAEVR